MEFLKITLLTIRFYGRIYPITEWKTCTREMSDKLDSDILLGYAFIIIKIDMHDLEWVFQGGKLRILRIVINGSSSD